MYQHSTPYSKSRSTVLLSRGLLICLDISSQDTKASSLTISQEKSHSTPHQFWKAPAAPPPSKGELTSSPSSKDRNNRPLLFLHNLHFHLTSWGTRWRSSSDARSPSLTSSKRRPKHHKSRSGASKDKPRPSNRHSAATPDHQHPYTDSRTKRMSSSTLSGNLRGETMRLRLLRILWRKGT